jgi:hypothetical protein
MEASQEAQLPAGPAVIADDGIDSQCIAGKLYSTRHAKRIASHLGDGMRNRLDDVILGHGISLLRWRGGGVKHPTIYAAFPIPDVTNFRR